MSAGEAPDPEVLRVFWLNLPHSTADAPIGMEIWVQELADLFTGAGNFSNPVKLVIK